MNDGMSITLEGERELFLNMQRRLDGCTQAGRRGLRKGALKIVNDAKGKLKTNGSVVTGMLRASGKVQAVEGDPDAIDAGFFGQNGRGGYAAYVEYGRGPTKAKKSDGILTLREALEQWIKKKLRFSKPADIKRMAFFMARKIHKYGTRPHPFFTPAVEDNKNTISEYIAEEVAKETKRDGK